MVAVNKRLFVKVANTVLVERAKQGLTLKELAEKSGLGTTWVWKIEHAEKTSLKSIVKVLTALGIDADNYLSNCK